MQIKFGRLRLRLVLALTVWLVAGCALQDRGRNKYGAVGLIVTPASHYSTQKARNLGDKYRENLNLLVERLIASPNTRNLRLANNIASAGGIGFFTHSAVKIPDERYLEVVFDTGERLEKNGDHSEKVARVFSLHGKEILMILTSDIDIYNEKELAGYGLNFTWRTVGTESANERAVVYLSKEKVKAFVNEDMSLNGLLADAVIFAAEKEGQVNLVSFHAPKPTPDIRAPIREQVLVPELPKSRLSSKLVLKPEVSGDQSENTNPNSTGPSGWVSKQEGRALPTGESSRFESPPAVSVEVGAGGVPDQKSGRSNAAEPQPITRMSPAHSEQMLFSDGRGMKPKTTPKETKPVLQSRTKDEYQVTSGPHVKPSPKKENIELSVGLTASKPSVSSRESRANEDSQPHLNRDFVTSPPAEALPSISKESDSENTVGNSTEVESSKESVKNGNVESLDTARFAPSTSEENLVEPLRQEASFAHNDDIKRIRETKSALIPKALEGYIIQMAFNNRSEAQRWGDIFQQRGYAVSMTESGTAELLRVRIGNFRIRDDAERELKGLRKDGLTGIILNFPIAYRPEVHSSLP